MLSIYYLILFNQVGNLMDGYQSCSLQHGAKVVLLMEIIEKSVQMGDKILVFR
jgi:hypothetical protein